MNKITHENDTNWSGTKNYNRKRNSFFEFLFPSRKDNEGFLKGKRGTFFMIGICGLFVSTHIYYNRSMNFLLSPNFFYIYDINYCICSL